MKMCVLAHDQNSCLTLENTYFELCQSYKKNPDFTPHTNLDQSVRVRTAGFRLIKNKSILCLSKVDITLVLHPINRVSQDHVMEVVLFDVAQCSVV